METTQLDNRKPDSAAQVASPTLGPWLKGLLSAAIVCHLTAVFVGPWAMPPQGSELARAIAGSMQPYLQAAFLNNGYRFFAPEPGPGHLVRYEVQAGDGRRVEGFFPDRNSERPRLLYHRYFMLSEFLNSISHPAAVELAEQYQQSYAGHLIHKYDAQSVKLYLRRHRLPSMAEVRGGMSLDDPSLYEEKLLVEWDRDE
jgi:hypothetical protein